MYDFITHTWNPIKGKCYHDCSYCYMKRWGEQKPIRLDEKEFKTDLGKGNYIFVGSSCDMFAEDIPENWIKNTINHTKKYNNKYLFQSKNPKRFKIFKSYYPELIKFCTTIETNRFYPDIMCGSPRPENRIYAYIDYITIEPIMDFDLDVMLEQLKYCSPDFVSIGADSKDHNLPEPSADKIHKLIKGLRKFTEVRLKSNLQRLLK